MRRVKFTVLFSLILAFVAPATSYATQTPSPQPSQVTTPAKQALTQAQKAAIALARSDFAAAKANAQNGFDRALADAQAIRDQAIAAAGKDPSSIKQARKNYRDSYKVILNAYKAALKIAKLNLEAALASAKSANVSH